MDLDIPVWLIYIKNSISLAHTQFLQSALVIGCANSCFHQSCLHHTRELARAKRATPCPRMMELDLSLWTLANSVKYALESTPPYREGMRENKNK